MKLLHSLTRSFKATDELLSFLQRNKRIKNPRTWLCFVTLITYLCDKMTGRKQSTLRYQNKLSVSVFPHLAKFYKVNKPFNTVPIILHFKPSKREVQIRFVG